MEKAKYGDTIVFDEPVEFLDGKVFKELKFITRSQFFDPESKQGYWVTSWRRKRYTIKREGE